VGPRPHTGWRLLVLAVAAAALAAVLLAVLTTPGRASRTATTPAGELRNSLLVSLVVTFLALLCALAYAVAVTRHRARDRGVISAQATHVTALFAASPVGIIEGLPDGTILAVNQALAQMVGYSTDELLQMRTEDLFDPSSAVDVADSMRGVVDGSVADYTGERLYRARSGAPVPVLVSVVVLRDEVGRLQRMVAFVADLTVARDTEAALRVSE
jgi:PAS domain S-box-containing protein